MVFAHVGTAAAQVQCYKHSIKVMSIFEEAEATERRADNCTHTGIIAVMNTRDFKT